VGILIEKNDGPKWAKGSLNLFRFAKQVTTGRNQGGLKLL
jgi:hypothetical protein